MRIMLRAKIASSNETYLITPSLLNAWAYIWESANSVKESENDIMSIEDKKTEAQEKAKQDFLKTLNRIPSEPNEYMLAGIEFEKQCYEGNTCISPIIKGGCYQIVGKKNVTIDGMNFLMYGRLDVLKGGTIYDIKRIRKYNLGKYKWSYQHGFYLDLFPRAYKFEYLAYDGNKLHHEVYYREECQSTIEAIKNFINWLKKNDLLNLYKEKWKSIY